MLELVRASFGVGNITKDGKDYLKYRVSTIKDLGVIIAHFDKYKLLTQKRSDFELFKRVVDLLDRKEHLTIDGLKRIVGIRASMNKGLSDSLSDAFPDIKPVTRPIVELEGIPDPYWIAGFTEGEGCFYIHIIKSSSVKTGFQVRLEFTITQHLRDTELMESLVKYFGASVGRMKYGSHQPVVYFLVARFSDLTEKIIPFFDKYLLHGAKLKDYAAFKKASELMKSKTHLTKDGLEEIKQIKSGMNRGRVD